MRVEGEDVEGSVDAWRGGRDTGHEGKVAILSSLNIIQRNFRKEDEQNYSKQHQTERRAKKEGRSGARGRDDARREGKASIYLMFNRGDEKPKRKK